MISEGYRIHGTWIRKRYLFPSSRVFRPHRKSDPVACQITTDKIPRGHLRLYYYIYALYRQIREKTRFSCKIITFCNYFTWQTTLYLFRFYRFCLHKCQITAHSILKYGKKKFAGQKHLSLSGVIFFLSAGRGHFLKNATATAPGPAWVPITLPMVVYGTSSAPASHRCLLS